MKKHIYFISLGCSKNQVDTEVMIGSLTKNWSTTQDITAADAVVINTCGFIDSAKQESINAILNAADSKKDGAKLIVAGCLSERYRQELAKELPEVDLFTGVGDFDKLYELLESSEKERFSEKVFLQDNQKRTIINSKYHAYIKISEGCNQSCSFCAIPLFKGKLQSRSIDAIVLEIKNLINEGFYDFSLIAQDSSSYGRDLTDTDLIKLIDAIDAIDNDFSVRILYLYPSTTTKKLIHKIENSKKVLPYFDMPIQHFSDKMLKTMKRGSGQKKIIELLNEMRNVKNSFVRTGIIVGHPNESEQDFEEMANFIDSFDFDGVSVFEYSDEQNTASCALKNKIDNKTRAARLKAIKKILDKKLKQKAKKQIGKTVAATIEGESEEHEFLIAAKSVLWAPEIDGEILINESDASALAHGIKVNIQITATAGKTLIGKVAEIR